MDAYNYLIEKKYNHKYYIFKVGQTTRKPSQRHKEISKYHKWKGYNEIFSINVRDEELSKTIEKEIKEYIESIPEVVKPKNSKDRYMIIGKDEYNKIIEDIQMKYFEIIMQYKWKMVK